MIAQVTTEVAQQVLSWERTAPGAFVLAVSLAALYAAWRYIIRPAIELGHKLGKGKDEDSE